MRPSFAFLSLLLCVACGGTASETPWPKEPEDINLGPAGEAERDRSGNEKAPAAKEGSDPAPSPKADPVAP